MKHKDSNIEAERKFNVAATFMKEAAELFCGEFRYNFADQSCGLAGPDIFLRYTKYG